MLFSPLELGLAQAASKFGWWWFVGLDAGAVGQGRIGRCVRDGDTGFGGLEGLGRRRKRSRVGRDRGWRMCGFGFPRGGFGLCRVRRWLVGGLGGAVVLRRFGGGLDGDGSGNGIWVVRWGWVRMRFRGDWMEEGMWKRVVVTRAQCRVVLQAFVEELAGYQVLE